MGQPTHGLDNMSGFAFYTAEVTVERHGRLFAGGAESRGFRFTSHYHGLGNLPFFPCVGLCLVFLFLVVLGLVGAFVASCSPAPF